MPRKGADKRESPLLPDERSILSCRESSTLLQPNLKRNFQPLGYQYHPLLREKFRREINREKEKQDLPLRQQDRDRSDGQR